MKEKSPAGHYITPVNTVMAIINIIVFIVLEILGNTQDAAFMYSHGAMYPYAVIDNGEWYRLITSAFIHFGFEHLVNNMVMFICLGSYIERALGTVKYIIFYLISAVCGNLASMAWMIHSGENAISGGASGVVFGFIGGLLWIVIINRGRFENLTLKRFILMAALSLYYGFTTAGTDNAAHIGAMAAGFLAAALLYRKRRKHTGRGIKGT